MALLCHCRDPAYICVRAIRTSKVYSINDKNCNHMYSSHNNNIKYIGSTIKYIDFEPIHYTTNLNVISSSMIFSNFNY